MQTALDQFKREIARARNLGAIHKFLDSQTTQVLDTSDILRAQLVLSVSALDLYIHEVTRLGILDIQRGKRCEAAGFCKFQVPLLRLKQSLLSPTDLTWLDSEIKSRHSVLSFQKAEKIADALRLIADVELWNEVALILTEDTKMVKSRLDLIIKRRNQIVHEADCDPTSPNDRWPIDHSMVNESTDYIESIVEAIHVIL